MEMTSSLFRDHLAEDAKTGKVTTQTIDDAVRRILRVKYEMGLFTHPYAEPGLAVKELVSAGQREEAKVAAERSTVLLRNEAQTLPLSKSLHSLAVVGPLADSRPD